MLLILILAAVFLMWNKEKKDLDLPKKEQKSDRSYRETAGERVCTSGRGKEETTSGGRDQRSHGGG